MYDRIFLATNVIKCLVVTHESAENKQHSAVNRSEENWELSLVCLGKLFIYICKQSH